MHLQAELRTRISRESICRLIYALKIDSLPLSVEKSSAARTSGMGPGPCLRGSSGWGANSSTLRCHLRTLENEGQSTSRVSGFYQMLEKNSCTSQGCQLTPVLEDSAVRENHLGKLEPALSCSWGRWTGGLTDTEGGGPEVRRDGREPLPVHAGESPLLSRSGGEKGLSGSGAGTLGPD